MTLCVDEKLVLIELVGVNFLLRRLTDHGEEERKRRDLALEKLQRARDEWNKRKAKKVKNKGRTIWYAEIKNVLIKEDVQIFSKRGYNKRLLWTKTNN